VSADGWLFNPELCALTEGAIQDRFERFHSDNPEVYDHFCQIVREARNKGFTNWSARAIFHVMRWEDRGPVTGDAGEDYLLNNDYSSRYARRWQTYHPDISGFFETRKLRTQ
jgi:hypothetical protein